jgi:hypothetical protein
MLQLIKVYSFDTTPTVLGVGQMTPVQNAGFNNLKLSAEGQSTYITRAFDAALDDFSNLNLPKDIVKKIYLVSDLDDTDSFEPYLNKFKSKNISLNIVFVGDSLTDGAKSLQMLAKKIPHSSYTTANTLHQTVEALATATHRLYAQKAAVVLLCDTSCSMQNKLGDSTRIEAAQAAANNLIRVLRSEAAAPQSVRKMANFSASIKPVVASSKLRTQRQQFSVGGISYVL